MKNFLKSKFLVAGIAALAFGACTDLKIKEQDSLAPTATAGTTFVKINPTKFLESAYQDLGAFTDQANIYERRTGRQPGLHEGRRAGRTANAQ